MIWTSARFQLRDHRNAVVIFYGVLISTLLLMFVTSFFLGSVSQGEISGVELATGIFLFVTGLNAFKESFFMFQQNGISRRTQFLGRLCTAGILCAFMATADRVYMAFGALLDSSVLRVEVSSLFRMLYSPALQRMNAFGAGVMEWWMSLCLYLALVSLGYVITLLYYRMNRPLKTAISTIVPLSLMALSAWLSMDAWMAIGSFFDAILGLSAQAPWRAAATFLGLAAAMSGLSWLLLRRAAIR